MSVEVGSTYRHYKGGLYVVVAAARLSEDRDREVVVYRSLATGATWVRPLRDPPPGEDAWEDEVAWPDRVMRRRFVLEQRDYQVGDAIRVKRTHHEHAGLKGKVTRVTDFSVYMLDAEGVTSPWDHSSVEPDPDVVRTSEVTPGDDLTLTGPEMCIYGRCAKKKAPGSDYCPHHDKNRPGVIRQDSNDASPPTFAALLEDERFQAGVDHGFAIGINESTDHGAELLALRKEVAELRVVHLDKASPSLVEGLKEIVADWTEQASVNEEGWSYRRGNNVFNEGAAFAIRHCVEEVQALLAGLQTDYPSIAGATIDERGGLINDHASACMRLYELSAALPEVEKLARKTPRKDMPVERAKVEAAKARVEPLRAEIVALGKRCDAMHERLEALGAYGVRPDSAKVGA